MNLCSFGSFVLSLFFAVSSVSNWVDDECVDEAINFIYDSAEWRRRNSKMNADNNNYYR